MAERLFALLQTNHGPIEVELFENHAPKTVRNFIELANGEREWTDPRTRAKTTDRLYDGTVFHRVIPGFMIQGGDPLGTGTGGPGYTLRRRDPPRAASSTGPTCSPWPTPARAPTGRSSSSPWRRPPG